MRTPRLTLSLLVAVAGLALGATPALAVKPIANTSNVDGITPVGADVHGTVDPRGEATAAWYQYGTTKKYGKRTPDQSAGVAPGVIAVSATLTGLKSSTTYHYRIVAESKDGRTNGVDR